MRILMLSAAALCALTATAQAEELLFRGKAKVLTATAACDGVDAGDILNAQFHPARSRISSQDMPWDALNLIGAGGTVSWSVETDPNGPQAFISTAFVNTSNEIIDVRDRNPAGQTTIKASVVPATMTATTPFVTISGEVRNPFGDNAACSFTFRAALTNRRD
jgi:hypothetical protein